MNRRELFKGIIGAPIAAMISASPSKLPPLKVDIPIDLSGLSEHAGTFAWLARENIGLRLREVRPGTYRWL